MDIDRFLAKVDKTETCWLWTGTIIWNGYGQFRNGKMVYAHRWSYEHWKGPIPDGLEIDHLCRVRNCVNPDHLEAVTRSVNSLRSPLKGAYQLSKTHCPRGHEYDSENTYIDRKGGRRCRTCAKQLKNKSKGKESDSQQGAA